MQAQPPKQLTAAALEGVLLKGRYHVVEKISHGGMAWVYRGITQKRKSVAIKVLFSHLAQSETACKRLKLEAKLQGSWSHPNIVRVLDSLDEDGLVGMIMEWVEGPTLQHLLEKNPRPLSHRGAVSVFLALTSAIGYAHENQVIHRDLKPSNILLQQMPFGFFPKVADFGIAKSLAFDGTALTASNSVMGTIQYMAPEQVTSSKNIDHRADIYSLGAMMYQLATGSMMFQVKGIHQWAYCQRHIDPTPPSELVPDVPASLEQVIMKCLAKEPGNRYPDCRSLQQALLATGLGQDSDETVLDVDDETQQITLMDRRVIREAKQNARPWSVEDALDLQTLTSSPTEEAPFGLGDAYEPGEDTYASTPAVSPELLAATPTNKTSIEASRRNTVPSTQAAPILPTGEEWAPEEHDPDREGPSFASGASVALSLYIGLMLGIVGGGFYWFWPKGGGQQSGAASDVRSIPQLACQDGAVRSCYTGPLSTKNKGICRAGTKRCRNGMWGACQGQRLPLNKEICNSKDDNCDGQIDESFPTKGRPCMLHEYHCQAPGRFICDPKGRGLLCRADQPAKERQIRLSLTPSGKSFQLYIALRRRRRSLRRYQVRGQTCFLIDGPSRVKLIAPGYESCSFPVSWKQQTIRVKMSKKSELLNVPHYCLQPTP